MGTCPDYIDWMAEEDCHDLLSISKILVEGMGTYECRRESLTENNDQGSPENLALKRTNCKS